MRTEKNKQPSTVEMTQFKYIIERINEATSSIKLQHKPYEHNIYYV